MWFLLCGRYNSVVFIRALKSCCCRALMFLNLLPKFYMIGFRMSPVEWTALAPIFCPSSFRRSFPLWTGNSLCELGKNLTHRFLANECSPWRQNWNYSGMCLCKDEADREAADYESSALAPGAAVAVEESSTRNARCGINVHLCPLP